MTMNLAKDPNGVIKAMTEVEGERWLKRQKAGQFSGFSVFEAIEELKKIEPSAAAAMPDFSAYVIQGEDGWNRYRVQMDGEVCFIKAMAWGTEAVEKARKAGFRIW